MSFFTYQNNAPNILVNMISQAGPRWTGSVAMNCDVVDDYGLIPILRDGIQDGL